jgi:hypothetical protein
MLYRPGAEEGRITGKDPERRSGIVQTLAEFARRTRYYNLDAVTRANVIRNSVDPMAAWDERVIRPIIEKHCTPTRPGKIEEKRTTYRCPAQQAHYGTFHGRVRKNDEHGACRITPNGETDIARKWAPLYVLQLARWVAFILADLSQDGAYRRRIEVLLGLEEHFIKFKNDDRYLKSRRTWSIYKL